MFANASLARRIERAEVGLILEGARAACRRVPADQPVIQELNGGAVVFLEHGAPFNKGVGFGFDGVPDASALDRIERQFDERRAPLQFEVSTLANPAVVKALAQRVYLLVGFENVLGLAIGSSHGDTLQPRPDVDVTRAAEDETRLWMDAVTEGFLHPDVFDGPATHESIPREVLERVFGDTAAAPGFRRYLARRGDEVAGGASFRMQDGVAQLSGAATLPQPRRRGVQTALLHVRLRDAAQGGCDVAVVTTQPGSKSQENAAPDSGRTSGSRAPPMMR